MELYRGLLPLALLGCGASAQDEPIGAEVAERRDIEVDALLARYTLPGQATHERLALVEEIETLPPEMSRRFQHRLLDDIESRLSCDQSSVCEIGRALVAVGVENESFGFNLPRTLIEDALWRAFAPRADEWESERVEELVERYAAALREMSPRARRDAGVSASSRMESTAGTP